MSLDEQSVPAFEAGQSTAFPAASWPHILPGGHDVRPTFISALPIRTRTLHTLDMGPNPAFSGTREQTRHTARIHNESPIPNMSSEQPYRGDSQPSRGAVEAPPQGRIQRLAKGPSTTAAQLAPPARVRSTVGAPAANSNLKHHTSERPKSSSPTTSTEPTTTATSVPTHHNRRGIRPEHPGQTPMSIGCVQRSRAQSRS